ncbi:MAG TPA: single-stranded DNA-binding protein [Planctomycetota bacterium]|jgi:single-strand selective monofunctional uracil DNA glycosylase|nr:MAG: Uracil DNA glycosylase superfamily protein [Planctomycetes bacterium ADurb.Bin069]HNR98309.1 single-stranded DNA-binding protein [Planctomycetota bacterium]HNU24627.1 single-stranded DNA-binding protein [Planctomycetota bacterium]HOE28979.1 single-stranded DNA-binding protein [Planctomycetota bacterium]HOE85901.1 single-stranded DNA-binding protein [Planctomycetota bacterium]
MRKSGARQASAGARLERIAEALCKELAPLRFAPPVTHVYNPLVYARDVYGAYVRRYARAGCEAVLLGMNPGPFGMAQSGVPFGDVVMVREWLGLEGAVGKPPVEHPARPVLGFDCPRREVSGTRLWGFARDAFGTPARFFARFFVINYCPLVFMEASGRNVTPDKLGAEDRTRLLAACDRALRAGVECLAPRIVIGVGHFAAARAAAALEGLPAAVGRILHPSPQSPAANRGWAAAAAEQLARYGLAPP